MEYTKSTLYPLEYIYTTNSTLFTIEFKALTYLDIDMLQIKYKDKFNQYQIAVIKQSLINKDDFYLLDGNDIIYLQKTILEVSTLTKKEMESIKNSIEIILDDSFKDDTFKSCSLCQERGLDKHRNCPMLPKEVHDDMVFYIVNNSKLSICPMKEVNSPIVGDALHAYNIYEAGQLPVLGGILNQTVFFNEVAPLVKGLITKSSNKKLDSR